ncbi:MAG: O-antigen ligase family protein [Clostridia bacterium]|nr:O-antigen ligase family protein [Clostridia bacterium]
MLKDKLLSATKYKAIKRLNMFFEGYIFPAVYAVIIFITSLFGLEIAFYALSLLICIYCTLFCKDSKPLLNLFISIVYSTSWRHTPQYPYNSDFFYLQSVHISILAMASVAVICFIFRMAVFGNGKSFFKDSRLRLGIILMCLAFLLNGVFYSDYTFKNLGLGVLVALSFFTAYLFFFGTLDVTDDTAKYVAYILTLAGGIIFLQIAKLYIFDGVIVDGSIDKDLIKLGWGMSNNAGGMLAIFLPSCFYLALKVKRGGGLLYALGFVYYLGVCLTLSRTSVLVGGIVLLCMFIYFSVKKTSFRKFVWIFNGALAAFGIVFVAVFWNKLTEIFAVYFERGFSDSGRLQIWLEGLKDFVSAPIFGVGFYGSGDFYDIDNWVFPDMYHNLFIQMLASCGLAGIAALVIHFVQVVFCVNKKPDSKTAFYLIIPAVIVAVSLLDNHIFHIFPAIVYSVFLLLIERDGEEYPLKKPKGLLRPKSYKNK